MEKLTERYNATIAEHNGRQARNRKLDYEAKRSLRILQKEYAILTADKAKNTYVIHLQEVPGWTSDAGNRGNGDVQAST
jgi:hypothetical protein